MSDDQNRFEIDVVDFQISCRRFTIRATITRDRQLPVVDEFVLRLLAVLDRMSVQRMRSWFGFTNSEMQTVLVDMGRRNLVEIVDDDIQLAPAGRDLFRSTQPAAIPHIVETFPIIENVWFDLVSRNMVPRTRARSSDYLVKVSEIPGARDLPENFARLAFEENFRDYAKRIRRYSDPDAVNLYSISDVEGGIYGHQVLRADLVLELDRLRVRPNFPDLNESAANYYKLTMAASSAWQSQTGSDTSAGAAGEFAKMTGDTRYTDVIEAPHSLDNWLDALARVSLEGDDFKATTGAPYLTRNVDSLLAAVGKHRPSSKPCEVIWLRPSGATWGRTQRVGEMLTQLRDALRNAGVVDATTTLAMSRSTPRNIRQSHKRLFDRGVLLPQGYLPANMEILLIPGAAALVNVHLPVEAHSAPIGGIVFNTKKISRILERLSLRQADGWEQLWEMKHASQGAES
jgi:hypothetical protein